MIRVVDRGEEWEVPIPIFVGAKGDIFAILRVYSTLGRFEKGANMAQSWLRGATWHDQGNHMVIWVNITILPNPPWHIEALALAMLDQWHAITTRYQGYDLVRSHTTTKMDSSSLQIRTPYQGYVPPCQIMLAHRVPLHDVVSPIKRHHTKSGRPIKHHHTRWCRPTEQHRVRP